MGGVVALGGAPAAYAMNASSPHVAATNLHNYIVRRPFQVEEGGQWSHCQQVWCEQAR